MSTDRAIATSSFLSRPPASQLPDEHNPDVPAQSPKSYEDLMRMNAQLRAAIREANHKIERMLAEIDVMVAKLQGVAK